MAAGDGWVVVLDRFNRYCYTRQYVNRIYLTGVCTFRGDCCRDIAAGQLRWYKHPVTESFEDPKPGLFDENFVLQGGLPRIGMECRA